MKILKEVSVLGTEYRIIESNCDNDPLLKKILDILITLQKR